MPLLPFENCKLESPLTCKEAQVALMSHIAWTKSFGLAFIQHPYKSHEGYVEGNHFKLRRILKWGRNSSIPTVSGELKENETGGCTIKLKIRMHRAVNIMLIFMVSFCLIMFYTENRNRTMVNEYPEEQSFVEYISERGIDLDEKTIEILKKEYKKQNPVTVVTRPISWISLWMGFLILAFLTLMFNFEAYRIKNDLKMILRAT